VEEDEILLLEVMVEMEDAEPVWMIAPQTPALFLLP